MIVSKLGPRRGGFILLCTISMLCTAVAVPTSVAGAGSCRPACSHPPPPEAYGSAVPPSASHSWANPLVPVTQVMPEPVGDRRVILYGDSLAWESQSFFVAALGRAGITKVTTRTFGGTAICDWLPQMHLDAATPRPDAVVVEFSGNALTPCMRNSLGGAQSGLAYFHEYAADAATVLRIFTPDHTLVFFAGAPISRSGELDHSPTTAILHTIYAFVAASTPYGRYVDAGASVLVDGRWTETLPCLPAEPCTGRRDASGRLVNVVRAPTAPTSVLARPPPCAE